MADNLVKFNLTGPGSIRAVDNGNAATVKPFHADHRKAFTGMALLIVSSQKGQAGRIHRDLRRIGRRCRRDRISLIARDRFRRPFAPY